MKISISLLVLCTAVAVNSIESPSGGLFSSSSQTRAKRGFRMGAADRFSHGFGKRGGDTAAFGEDSLGATNWYMSSEELARLLRTNPKLSMMFVEKYIDLDGDGLITRDEIMDSNITR